MMGERLGMQESLFYEFRFEDHVPADYLLRGIDPFVDLSELRRHLAGFYSSTGRPSVDPELMIRMLIIGYCLGIRSERRLCEEVHLNLAYRWFCPLGFKARCLTTRPSLSESVRDGGAALHGRGVGPGARALRSTRP
jgi:transposase